MVSLFTSPKFSVSDDNGAPLAGGKLFFYAAGTSTKQDTWTDSTGTVKNTNPVLLNARGEASVWLDPALTYKVMAARSTDTDPPTSPIWTMDNVGAGAISIGASDNASGSLWTTVQGFINAQQIHNKAFVVAADAPYNVSASNTAAANATGINAALAYCNSLGGGQVILPGGTIQVSATIDNKYPRVVLVGTGIDYAHNSGTDSTTRTTLKATFAGTVLKIRTPYAAEQGVSASATQKYWGAGAVGFSINCNGIATKACEIDSVSGVDVQLYATGCVGSTCFEVKCGVTGTSLGEACDVQHSRIWVAARLIDTTSERTCHILTLNGSSNANVSLNRAPLSGIFVGGQHYTGHALYGISADNNDITISAQAVSTGKPIYAKGPTASIPVGFDTNTIHFLSSAVAGYAEGTDTGGVTAGVTNIVDALDTGNGTPSPTSGTNSKWVIRTATGIDVNSAATKIAMAEDAPRASAQRALINNETVRIHNQSGDNVRLTDGSNEWSVNVDGATGDLRMIRILGTGKVNLGNGAPVQLGGSVGFQGNSPIAKPTVTGSKGANAALTSLLTALASYGLITDSTS